MPELRAGVIGTGGIGTQHATALRSLGVEVTACYGTNPSKVAAFADAFGARIFDDATTMVSSQHLDVLFIAVPPYAHDGSLEQLAVVAGIPFLVEKPIGLDPEICLRTAVAIEARGLVTAVGYMLREVPALGELRSVVARNRFASVRSVRATEFPQARWWRRMDESGGMMVEQATHMADLLRHVFGEANAVAAATSSGIGADRWVGSDVYDAMETIIRFESGLVGSMSISNVLNNGFRRVEILEAFGADCYISLDFERLRYQVGEDEWVRRDVPDHLTLLAAQDRRFLDAVASGDPGAVGCSYADGLRTLELTLAMTEAARVGGWVAVPDRLASTRRAEA
jgi:myo-inositol 2-dehydrogenase / D-chiro-inositol 1-dehydrogenase